MVHNTPLLPSINDFYWSSAHCSLSSTRQRRFQRRLVPTPNTDNQHFLLRLKNHQKRNNQAKAYILGLSCTQSLENSIRTPEGRSRHERVCFYIYTSACYRTAELARQTRPVAVSWSSRMFLDADRSISVLSILMAERAGSAPTRSGEPYSP